MDHRSAISFEYDGLGRVTSETTQIYTGSKEIEYAYDQACRRLQLIQTMMTDHVHVGSSCRRTT
jgi:hypothetical protein